HHPPPSITSSLSLTSIDYEHNKPSKSDADDANIFTLPTSIISSVQTETKVVRLEEPCANKLDELSFNAIVDDPDMRCISKLDELPIKEVIDELPSTQADQLGTKPVLPCRTVSLRTQNGAHSL